jgi:hypothetical protein
MLAHYALEYRKSKFKNQFPLLMGSVDEYKIGVKYAGNGQSAD